MISIIIPAHQEEQQISKTLKSCVNQDFKDFEVIVVANGCTDGTVKITERFMNRLNMKIVETKKKGIGYASNLGAKKSNGNILVFLDADTLISKNALYEINKSIKKGIIAGTLHGKPDEKSMIFQLYPLLLILSNGAGWGALRFCTKKLFNKMKGYKEENDYGVDTEFSIKMKKLGKTKYITSAYYITSMRRYKKEGFSFIFDAIGTFFCQKIGIKKNTNEYYN